MLVAPLRDALLARRPFDPFALFGAAIIANWDASRPDTITLNGGNVSAWASSVRNLALSQGTSALQPAYSGTGWDGVRPALTFDGVSGGNGDWLGLTWSDTIAAHTIFAVAEVLFANDTAYRPLVRFISGNLHGIQHQSSGDGVSPSKLESFTINTAASVFRSTPAATTTTGKKLLCSVLTQTQIQLHTNGASATAAAVSGAMASAVGNAFYLCRDDVNSRGHYKVAHVLITPAVTLVERQKTEGYLAWKWGIQGQLVDGHPYKWRRP